LKSEVGTDFIVFEKAGGGKNAGLVFVNATLQIKDNVKQALKIFVIKNRGARKGGRICIRCRLKTGLAGYICRKCLDGMNLPHVLISFCTISFSGLWSAWQH
jgi:hypothetical protein